MIAAMAVGFLAHGCREQSTAPIDRNAAPETVLVEVPGDSTTAFYRIDLHWYGSDSDGRVVGYDWAITDSLPPDPIPWKFTTRTDSTFIFSVEETRQVLGHRFYVRAVDNEGKVDPTPAWAFFGARDNCIPVASFLSSHRPTGPLAPYALSPDQTDTLWLTSTNQTTPGDTVPTGWSVHFAWTGSDCDVVPGQGGKPDTVGRVTGYVSRLIPLELNDVIGDTAQTSAQFSAAQLASGLYVMQVKARDDAGMLSTSPAIRAFVWNKDPDTRFADDSYSLTNQGYYSDLNSNNFRTFTNGDTLPMRAAGIQVKAYVVASDPDPVTTDPTKQIVSMDARVVQYSGFWTSLMLNPDERSAVFGPTGSPGYFTGDYTLMARSQDSQGRYDGSPCQIRFSINHPPRWQGQWQAGSPPVQKVMSPVNGQIIHANDPGTLTLDFAVIDPDTNTVVNPILAMIEFNYRFVQYPSPTGPGGDSDFTDWSSGVDTVQPDGTTQVWSWEQNSIRGDNSPFLPGDYILEVQAKEVPPQGSESFGSRLVDSGAIHFTIANP